MCYISLGRYNSIFARRMGRGGCMAAFAVLMALISVQSFAAENGEVRKIRFKGNKEFSDSELKKKISFAQSTWLGQKLFNRKITYYSDKACEMNVAELIHFYQAEGFLDVEADVPTVKTVGRKGKVEITFIIKENRPVVIDSVGFCLMNPAETVEGFPAGIRGRRKGVITARKGQRFRDEQVWNDKENISKNLINRGYPYAEVNPRTVVDTATKTATIVWEIQRGTLGYFGDIAVEGQKRTPEKTVRKQLAVKSGDVYSREKLNLSQQQIYQLGTFRTATVKAQLTREQTDTVSVTVTLNEAPRTSTRAGVGYGREDHFRGFVDFTILNFPGGARRLNIYAKHSALEPYRVEATLTQPAVFGVNSTLSLSPFVKKQEELNYKLLNYGVNAVLSQKFTQYVSGSFNPYYERIDLDEAPASSLVFNFSPPEEKYSKSGIAAGLIFDSSRPQFEPASGWVITFNAKANSIVFNGDYPFYKYIAEVKNYRRIAYGVVVASKFKTGSAVAVNGNGFIPVEELFYAGGSRSVRGWARQQLTPTLIRGSIHVGGRSIIEISVEPRIKIYGPLSFVVFSDIGNVWLQSNYYRFGELRFSAGAGLRIATPIGPIGIDFARPLFDVDTKWQFHLNIGNSF